MRRVRSTNPQLLSTVRLLRKVARENDAPIWRDVADRLSSSRRRRVTINVGRLNRHAKDGETVVVPGKVLGAGTLDHAFFVAAFAFSGEAENKILRAKGKCLSISELAKANPKGSKVRIME